MKDKNESVLLDIQEHLHRPYSRILIPQDGRFSAEILEFPGCFAFGETPEAAYHNLEKAAEAWIASCISRCIVIPQPLTNYNVSGRFALRLPKSLYLRVSKAAVRDGVSFNQFVTNAISEKLGMHKATKKLDELCLEMKNIICLSLLKSSEKYAENDTLKQIPGIPENVKIDEYASNNTIN